MNKPSKPPFTTMKGILRFVKGTKCFRIMYEAKKDYNLIGYIDSDWNEVFMITRAQLHIFLFLVPREFHGIKEVGDITLSFTEAKYMVTTNVACEAF